MQLINFYFERGIIMNKKRNQTVTLSTYTNPLEDLGTPTREEQEVFEYVKEKEQLFLGFFNEFKRYEERLRQAYKMFGCELDLPTFDYKDHKLFSDGENGMIPLLETSKEVSDKLFDDRYWKVDMRLVSIIKKYISSLRILSIEYYKMEEELRDLLE